MGKSVRYFGKSARFLEKSALVGKCVLLLMEKCTFLVGKCAFLGRKGAFLGERVRVSCGTNARFLQHPSWENSFRCGFFGVRLGGVGLCQSAAASRARSSIALWFFNVEWYEPCLPQTLDAVPLAVFVRATCFSHALCAAPKPNCNGSTVLQDCRSSTTGLP